MNFQDLNSETAEEATTPSEVSSSRQQRANRDVPPNGFPPAASLSASGGAAATRDGLIPFVGMSPQQSSRSGGEEQAIERSQPRGDAPAPQPSRARKGAAGQATERMRSKRGLPDPTPSAPVAGRSDPMPNGTHIPTVAAATLPDREAGSDDGALCSREPQAADSPVVAEIVQLWRMRQRWWKAELKLILQAQAICRMWTDGDKAKAGKLFAQVRDTGEGDPVVLTALAPFIAAMQPFAAEGAAYEKRIAKLARSLPVWNAWGKGVWGLSDLALGKIVGECGDVGSYRNPSCVWKRMGVAVINGQRQRRVTDADEALLHGYNAQRRSNLWNIGNGLIGGMGKGVRPSVGEDWQAREDWSPYQKLYVGRLLYEAERDPDAHVRPDTAAGKMSFSKHAHNRAKRYVEKRLLRDLWSAWRAADRGHRTRDPQLLVAPVGTSFEQEN